MDINSSFNATGFTDKALMSIDDNQISRFKSQKNLKQVEKAAKDFEAFFITQSFSQMYEGIKSDETFGGGEAENIYRSMLLNEYGKAIAEKGGIGLADSVKTVMLQAQEGTQK